MDKLYADEGKKTLKITCIKSEMSDCLARGRKLVGGMSQEPVKVEEMKVIEVRGRRAAAGEETPHHCCLQQALLPNIGNLNRWSLPKYNSL